MTSEQNHIRSVRLWRRSLKWVFITVCKINGRSTAWGYHKRSQSMKLPLTLAWLSKIFLAITINSWNLRLLEILGKNIFTSRKFTSLNIITWKKTTQVPHVQCASNMSVYEDFSRAMVIFFLHSPIVYHPK